MDYEEPNEPQDFGARAIYRRLGELAMERRQLMGLGRIPFSEMAGLGSESTVTKFEHGVAVPRGLTRKKLESALGWREGVISAMLQDKEIRASSIEMEDLEDPSNLLPYVEPGSRSPLRWIATEDLLAELMFRIRSLDQVLEPQRRRDLYGNRLRKRRGPEGQYQAGEDDRG